MAETSKTLKLEKKTSARKLLENPENQGLRVKAGNTLAKGKQWDNRQVIWSWFGPRFHPPPKLSIIVFALHQIQTFIKVPVPAPYPGQNSSQSYDLALCYRLQ